MRRSPVVLAVGVTLLLGVLPGSIGKTVAQAPPSPPHSHAYGHTLAEWMYLYLN